MVKKLIVLFVLILIVYGCGKRNVTHEHYEQKHYVSPGPFIGCEWYGRLEICRFENVTCRRNFLLYNPEPICTKN